MPLQLLEGLDRHAAEDPGRIALQQLWPKCDAAMTWGQLCASVRALSERLKESIPPGSVVLLCSPNRPQFTAAFLAILRAKLTVFPLAPDLAAPELREAAERSGAAGLVAIGQANLPLLERFARKAAIDELGADAVLLGRPSWTARAHAGVSMLLLSSGTTGKPKIVRRDAASLDAVSAAMAQAVGFTRDDCVLAATPLFHSYGVEHGLLAPMWAGSQVDLCDGFERQVVHRHLLSGSTTIFPGVPFMYEMLCDAAVDSTTLTRLRRAYSAGGPLPRALFERMEQKFGARVTQLYGATEIGSVTFHSPEDEPFDPGSVGRAIQGVQLLMLDPSAPDTNHPLPTDAEGHVAIKAASMLSGYLDGEPAPLLDGYFLTGDLGRLDPRGRLTITGRIKLLIDIGGRKVNPLEVEEVIARHPDVGACVVVPMEMSETLFRLKAIVVPARPDAPPDPRELRGWVRERLSHYKVPRVFEVRSDLPRSAAGKILRNLGSDK